MDKAKKKQVEPKGNDACISIADVRPGKKEKEEAKKAEESEEASGESEEEVAEVAVKSIDPRLKKLAELRSKLNEARSKVRVHCIFIVRDAPEFAGIESHSCT